ncbi:MAG: hypothetical protein HC828_03405 [Blastochloris sp.]|nr:hypothetical protein [Blastochloris sp.]
MTAVEVETLPDDTLPAIPEDPTMPFGVVALPNPALPISAEGLRRAYEAMLAHYAIPLERKERHGEVISLGKQIDKAYAVACDTEKWAMHADHVEIRGNSGRYHTRPDWCESTTSTNAWSKTACPGQMAGRIGCYHQIAVELLRLAQVCDAPALLDTLEPQIRLDLPGFAALAMFGAISIVQKQEPTDEVEIMLDAMSDTISLVAGPYNTSAPANPAASWLLSLSQQSFADLWAALRPDALHAGTLALQVALTDHTGTLTLTGGAINIAVPVAGYPL